jgi:excisionase family DNA binding protein
MKLYSTSQVASDLDVSTVYVNKLIHTGKLKAERVGKGFVIHSEAVEEYKKNKQPVGRPRKDRNK